MLQISGCRSLPGQSRCARHTSGRPWPRGPLRDSCASSSDKSGARICRSLGHFAGGAEGVSRASRRAVRLRPPRNLQYSDAGSRWAYRGRPAHPYAQSARDTPRQHSLGGRDRCPVCAPGAAYAPTSYLVLLAPRKDGAAAGGIPLPRRLVCRLPGAELSKDNLTAGNKARRVRQHL